MIRTYESFRNKFRNWVKTQKEVPQNSGWIIIDENVYIKKMEGKIYFGIRSNKFEHFKLRSMLLGICRLIGTKYEYDPRVRQVSIDLKVEVNASTRAAVIRDLLLEMGYDEKEMLKRKAQMIHQDNSDKYRFLGMIEKSNNLGELMDNFKIFKQEFMAEEQENFEEWLLQINVKKYNL